MDALKTEWHVTDAGKFLISILTTLIFIQYAGDIAFPEILEIVIVGVTVLCVVLPQTFAQARSFLRVQVGVSVAAVTQISRLPSPYSAVTMPVFALVTIALLALASYRVFNRSRGN